jgi:hypothetical protein
LYTLTVRWPTSRTFWNDLSTFCKKNL